MSNDTVTADHWGLAPFKTHPLDESHFLLLRVSDGSSAVLDAAWEAVLGELAVFRTLAEHTETITATIPALQGNASAVEALLAQLVEKGLFQGVRQLAADTRRAAGTPQRTPGPLRIFIITCDRPEALKRLLDSLVANEERFGNRWRFEVIDDSRSAQAQQQNSVLVREAGQWLDIEYLGPAEQRRFLDGLFRELPEAREARWLLERDAGETEPTYGLPMNLALLRHAGRHLLMIDDDALIRAAQLPDGSQTPRFDQHQQVEIFFTMKEARAALQPYEQDPFTAHAAALGQLVSALVPNAVGAEPQSSFIDEKISKLASFNPQRSRVRYTLNGLLGDTGTHNDLMVFAPKHLKAHTAIFGSDARYRRLKASDRIIYRGSPWPSLYNSGWLHQVTCVGVDGSGFVAPVYPAGRGADTCLGLMLRFLYPDCYGLLLPFTLEHWAVGKRAWRFDPGIYTFNPSVNGMLLSFLSSLRISTHLQPARRMAAFAEALRE